MRDTLGEKLRDIESEPTGYAALRFVIGMINVVGWLLIVLHTFITLVIIYPYMRMQLTDTLPTYLLTILAWMGGSFAGVAIIASAQVLEILMDIRRDLHITRRYIRAFGLDNAQ